MLANLPALMVPMHQAWKAWQRNNTDRDSAYQAAILAQDQARQ
jgi:hypothetical protein